MGEATSTADDPPTKIFPLTIQSKLNNISTILESLEREIKTTGEIASLLASFLSSSEFSLLLSSDQYDLKAGSYKLSDPAILKFLGGAAPNPPSASEAQECECWISLCSLLMRCGFQNATERQEYRQSLWNRGIALLDPSFQSKFGITENMIEEGLTVHSDISKLIALFFLSQKQNRNATQGCLDFGMVAMSGLHNSVLSSFLSLMDANITA